MLKKPKRRKWQNDIQRVIFETDTPAAKKFDILLLIAIAGSFFVIILSSVKEVRELYGEELYLIEWGFTLLFSVEYIARIISVNRKRKYIFSLFGLIDLLSILPTYISLIIVESQSLAILRTLRLVRIFRVLELPNYTKSTKTILDALQASRPKITVFLTAVFTIIIVIGGLMYVIEGEETGFTSIPKSIYWAIVTITTVGYGDIAPQTVLGQTLASIMMLLGYSILAVPTGIVSGEFIKSSRREMNAKMYECKKCNTKSHQADANFCRVCGSELDLEEIKSPS